MTSPQPPAEAAAPAAIPLCPHCREPLLQVNWLLNPEVGLLTFYHAAPTCMVALNCQIAQVKRLVEPAGAMAGKIWPPS